MHMDGLRRQAQALTGLAIVRAVTNHRKDHLFLIRKRIECDVFRFLKVASGIRFAIGFGLEVHFDVHYR